ncbi:MAG: putative membrane protein [Candidatus Paceibacteria bacterium]|jgi:uncharacterized membrane protein
MSFVFLLATMVSLGGLFIAYYIYSTKKKNETLVCPLDGSCDTVIKSTYSKFLGLPVDLLGIIYYGVTMLGYLLLFVGLIPYTPVISILSILIAVSGALFSIYLVSIQGFVLKEWCTWCLISAFVSFLIAIFAVYGSEFKFISALVEYQNFLAIFHALMVSLGIGGALITDIFFFKFLKDYRIAKEESEVLKTFYQIMWVALTGIIVTGLLLFLSDITYYSTSQTFIARALIVLIIGLGGGLLNLVVFPKIQEITFGGEHTHRAGELSRLRKTAFAVGSVSIVSWVVLFILGSVAELPYSAKESLGVYVVVLILSVLVSQVYAKMISGKKH